MAQGNGKSGIGALFSHHGSRSKSFIFVFCVQSCVWLLVWYQVLFFFSSAYLVLYVGVLFTVFCNSLVVCSQRTLDGIPDAGKLCTQTSVTTVQFTCSSITIAN